MTLFEMSISGAVMIVVILILRRLLMHKLPKRIFPILWGVVILRLLLPFSVASSYSVYTWTEGLLPESSTIAETITNEMQQPTVAEGNVQYVKQTLQQPIQQVQQADEVTAVQGQKMQRERTLPLGFLVWAIGAGAVSLFFIVSYIRCYREFGTSLPVEAGAATELLRTLHYQNSLNAWDMRKITIRESDRISSPLTYGIYKPVLLLPKQMRQSNQNELEQVLLHEYLHICNWDALWKMICITSVCLHWFNPMVWVMYFYFNRDLELACDESVLQKLGREQRKEYARTLIGLEEQMQGKIALYNGFGNNAVQERIRAIMKFQKKSWWIIVICVVLVVGVAGIFATSAKEEEPVNEETTVNEQDNQLANSASEEAEDLQSAETFDPPIEETGLPEETWQTEETYTLKYVLEGMEEEEPADLYEGAGYSFLIPKEGWGMITTDAWWSERNKEIHMWVVRFLGDMEQVKEELTTAGFEGKGNNFYLEDANGYLQFRTLIEYDGSVFAFCYSYPNESDYIEGVGARLPVMGVSFQTVPMSKDSQEVYDLVYAFSDAYFQGDKQSVESYLPEDYPESDVELWENVGSVSGVNLKGLENIQDAADGDTYTVSVEFFDPQEVDGSLYYLSIGVERQNGEWNIDWYGLEK